MTKTFGIPYSGGLMTSNILVTGGTGMVGKAIESICPNATFVGSSDCDLRSPLAVNELFLKHRPKFVIHLAARVGGVKGNSDYVADFFTDNIMINTNVLSYAHKFKVEKAISLLSTCVYPDKEYITYPLTEEQLHLGNPHESNYGYAFAKRMLDVQSRAFRKQFGSKFMCAIPNNIFGKHDNFDLENGHVVPAIIRKVWEAKHETKTLELWGDGSPLREFTSSNDIAKALLFLLYCVEYYDSPINIGNVIETSIKEMTGKICGFLDYDGEVFWDVTKPAGQFRKPSSNALFTKLMKSSKDGSKNGFVYGDLDDDLKATCDWFKESYPYVRGVK